MPSIRKCTKCQARHGKPTGRNCQWVPVDGPPNVEATTLDQILGAVQKIHASGVTLQNSVDTLTTRVATIESCLDSSDDDDDEFEEAKEQLTDEREDSDPKNTRYSLAPKLDAVQKRINDLRLPRQEQETVSNKGKKSGRSLTSKDAGQAIMDWPQFHVYRTAGRPDPTFDDLSVTEFAAGFTATIREQGLSPSDRDIQLLHFQKLMVDAQTWDWTTVRHFHGILRQEIEANRLNWRDAAAIQELRLTYLIQAGMSKRSTPAATAKKTTPRLPVCVPFQTGACPSQASPHDSDKGNVRHVCAFCLSAVGYGCYHPENQCQRKTKNAAPESRN